jgi:hypothetical protein
MKVYIAARDLERARKMRDRIEEIPGVTCCARWIVEADPAKFGKGHDYGDEERQRQARTCFEDVLAANVIVSLGENSMGKGGRHVEFGMGLALYEYFGQPECFHVGEKENVFHWSSEVECVDSDDAFVETLRKISEE